ncbi:hypothetical protein PAXRUDRAFT_322485 [Paxillus rubicundulus Ve08.2h10]|uniref:Uncharacterized protein n=1 Tax=Paxillus rubicundulus Ve08.2h10 TaxID=930991 RepID=A0A0D0DS89_9AGAM|nr:hypothetical protein PAXRUDRAFT_322485 [Paxillus rubicundulus Ve08.2h10]
MGLGDCGVEMNRTGRHLTCILIGRTGNMSNSIKMDDLSQLGKGGTLAGAAKDNNAGTAEQESIDIAIDRLDESVSFWAWASAAGIAVFSLCLLAFPRFLLFLAEPSRSQGTLTSLEQYLALQLGIILGTVAVTIISAIPNESPHIGSHRKAPHPHPLLGPVTAASLMMALSSYSNRSIGTLATTVLVGSGFNGLFGLWMLVFAGSSVTSRKTGADKHTSSFIFCNKSAASVKKRLWKRDQVRNLKYASS